MRLCEWNAVHAKGRGKEKKETKECISIQDSSSFFRTRESPEPCSTLLLGCRDVGKESGMKRVMRGEADERQKANPRRSDGSDDEEAVIWWQSGMEGRCRKEFRKLLDNLHLEII